MPRKDYRPQYRDIVEMGRAMRKGRPAPTPFAQFLWAKLRELDLSQGDFARELGVSPAAMCRWLKGEVTHPPQRAYDRLRKRFGDEVPTLVTEEERSRAQALGQLATLNARPQRVRSKRAREAGRAQEKGKGKKPEHSKRMKQWYASPAGQEHRARLRESVSSRTGVTTPEGRSLVSLGKFLSHNPEATKEDVPAFGEIVKSCG